MLKIPCCMILLDFLMTNSRESSPLELYDLSVYENENLSSTPLYDGAKMTVMDALVKYLIGIVSTLVSVKKLFPIS